MTNSASLRPLDFSMDNTHGNPDRYGRYFWAVGLPDGREATFNADRVEVTSVGALIAWRDTKPGAAERDLDGEREPLDTPQPTLILPPGAWSHCYAASATDSSPVCVNYLPAPNRPESGG